MKILIACSKYFYEKIPEIKKELEKAGNIITLPNSYNEPFKEEEMKKKGLETHIKWKSEMIKKHEQNLEPNDAILILNFEKNGEKNYIGGAERLRFDNFNLLITNRGREQTFLEIYKAFEMNKKIFFYNSLPENKYFKDELIAFNAAIINKDLTRII